MTERFLVTSDLNGTELLRSLALRGISTFAFRVVSAAELAETALIRCGRLPEGKRMRLSEQRFVTGALMQRAEYFARAFSFGDAVRLTDTLNSMRLRFAADEARGLREALPKGEFADKNAAPQVSEVQCTYSTLATPSARPPTMALPWRTPSSR